MKALRAAVVSVILAGVIAGLVVPTLVDRNSSSVASLARGTDDAFAMLELEPRENQIGGAPAIRWSKPKALFGFSGVGPGLVEVDIEARGHRNELTLSANGATIGRLLPGQERFTSRVRLAGSSLQFGVETDGFAAGGRTLGTQIVSLRIQPVSSGGRPEGEVSARLWLVLGGLVLGSALAQFLSGLSSLLTFLPPTLLLVLVLPSGLWRSAWLTECAGLIGLVILASALVAKSARGGASSRSWLQVTAFMAGIVHGVLPPSPLLVQGDAQLHGNKLGEVSRGNLFPLSRTDHKPPFDFPYGFSFYGVLTPLVSPEVTNVGLVRAGAAGFSALSGLALAFFLGRTSASWAAAATVLWVFAPVNIRTMGFGNLSNVFAQAVFVLFLVGAGTMGKGVARGACLTLLAAVCGMAHLSSFIVLFTLLLLAFLIPTDRNSAAFKPLFGGVAIAGAYYASFLPMVMVQFPRLLNERGGSTGVFDPWRLPNQLVAGAGWPLIAMLLLSALSVPMRAMLPMSRSLGLTGILLAFAALFSPIEVRYLLALAPLLTTLGGAIMDPGDLRSFPRQNLSSLVDLPWLRVLGSERVSLPLLVLLLGAAVLDGTRVLLGFVPLSGL